MLTIQPDRLVRTDEVGQNIYLGAEALHVYVGPELWLVIPAGAGVGVGTGTGVGVGAGAGAGTETGAESTAVDVRV